MAIQYGDPGGEFYYSLAVSPNGVLSAPGMWFTSSNAFTVNNAPTGRATQYAMIMNGGGTADKTIPANYTEFIMGGAYYVPSTFTNNTVLMAMMDAGNFQVEVRVDGSGHLVITRNGTTLGTSTLNLTANQGWVYIEFKSKIDASTGTAQVWVNGVSWLSLTSQNTKSTANAYMNRVRYGSVVTSAINSYWKDMYGLDTGTGTNTTLLGDITVNVFFPNGAGTNQQWTPNTGTQTAAVQDGTSHSGTWPDGDTTYISDATSGHISDFAHQALSLTGTIYGVIHMSYARKDDAGARSVNQVCLSGGTTETGAAISLGNTYNYYLDVIENDPNTSAAWTVTNFNNATFGMKIA
jgi:hypothetical protein